MTSQQQSFIQKYPQIDSVRDSEMLIRFRCLEPCERDVHYLIDNFICKVLNGGELSLAAFVDVWASINFTFIFSLSQKRIEKRLYVQQLYSSALDRLSGLSPLASYAIVKPDSQLLPQFQNIHQENNLNTFQSPTRQSSEQHQQNAYNLQGEQQKKLLTFLVDVKSGLTQESEQILQQAHQQGIKIISLKEGDDNSNSQESEFYVKYINQIAAIFCLYCFWNCQIDRSQSSEVEEDLLVQRKAKKACIEKVQNSEQQQQQQKRDQSNLKEQQNYPLSIYLTEKDVKQLNRIIQKSKLVGNQEVIRLVKDLRKKHAFVFGAADRPPIGTFLRQTHKNHALLPVLRKHQDDMMHEAQEHLEKLQTDLSNELEDVDGELDNYLRLRNETLQDVLGFSEEMVDGAALMQRENLTELDEKMKQFQSAITRKMDCDRKANQLVWSTRYRRKAEKGQQGEDDDDDDDDEEEDTHEDED
eukprot:TRINITY_DN3730_c0_g4_i2.p1 TRINITY_DN3730_c0_g4~~TRINITY_DN3730_c0_g4_i2.p1  ORF type:complete len:471 (+),score=70.67 TRINITY_DN3730_c0_g4_i2:192-1604(+)